MCEIRKIKKTSKQKTEQTALSNSNEGRQEKKQINEKMRTKKKARTV